MCLVVGAVAVIAGRDTLAFADDDDAAAAEAALAMPTDPEALKHLAEGDAHYRLREFQEAVESYRAGARVQPGPRFLYNLAQAFRQLDDYENALWYFKQWISTASPPDSMRLPIEAIMAELRDDLAKVASTRPPTDPAGDGVFAGDRGPRWYADGLGWGLTGSGVASAAVGVGLLLNPPGLEEDATAGVAEEIRTALREKASTRRIVGAVLAGVGGVALFTGVVRLVLTPGGRRAAAAAPTKNKKIDVSLGLGWVGVQGSF